MLVHKCARCSLHGLGLNRLAAGVVGSVPIRLGARLADFQRSGKLWTALRMSELMSLRHQARHAFLDEVDHIVAVCEWGHQVLVRNGVVPSKITACRQGVIEYANTGAPAESRRTGHDRARSTLDLAFVGRLDPLKGLEVLFRALHLAPELALRLDIFGVAQGEAGTRYEGMLHRLAQSDERIRFRGPMPSGEVIKALRDYDALVVPSQCLETGPLVVLEAFAAGIPVIGSRLGGIAELISDEENGLLVDAASVEAWARTLRRIAEDRGLLSRLRQGVRAPRTMGEVADEMLALYERLPLSAASDCER